MNILNHDYKKFYKLYKKLPIILSICNAILTIIWCLIDAIIPSEIDYGDWVYYGVLDLDSAFLALIIWLAIGAVLVCATWFFSTLAISANIAKTDAILEINNKLNKD